MKKNKAFTLIELLIVIAIVALLSSIIFSFVGEARAEARDNKKIQESNQVRNAIALYVSKNYESPIGTNPDEIEESLKVYNENSSQYQSAMQQLVDGDFIPMIPSSPNGKDYYYLIDDSGNGVFGAILESKASMNDSNGCYFTESEIGCSGSNANYITEFDRDSLIAEADSCSLGTCGSVSVGAGDEEELGISDYLDDIYSIASAYRKTNGTYAGLCNDSEIQSALNSLSSISNGTGCWVSTDTYSDYRTELALIDYGVGVKNNGVYYGVDPTGTLTFDSVDTGGIVNWSNANSSCTNGKRLPGPSVLRAIYDTIPSGFVVDRYWSHLEAPSDTAAAYILNFDNGGVGRSHKGHFRYVRCVN